MFCYDKNIYAEEKSDGEKVVPSSQQRLEWPVIPAMMRERILDDKVGRKMNLEQKAQWINTLAEFCGMRSVSSLTRRSLRERYGWEQADVMILFGGSILCGADVFAGAIQEQVAFRYLIAGGEGHTTDTLRQTIHRMYPQIVTAGFSEAECFAALLKERWGLVPDYLETQSTNCGNNVTNCLRLLALHGISPKRIIFSQDASMQRRMDAGFRRECPDDVTLVNYASYSAHVIVRKGQLAFAQEIPGMWEIERYLSLLLGEIPRLTDDENGYGPRGKGFIAHVEIPQEVKKAYEGLCTEYAWLVRGADKAYATIS